jgi:hypothetical protein
MKKTSMKLSGLLVVCVVSLAALQVMGQVPDINSFFRDLKNKVIDGANQLAQWKADAEAAGRKTASDFTDCPSQTAQNLYNDLKNKLSKAREVKRQAEESDQEGQAQRDKCKNLFPAFKPQCDGGYNSLQFKTTAAAAAGTIASLEAAINALKNLKCQSDCNRQGKIHFPKLEDETNSNSATTAGGYTVSLNNKGEYYDVAIEEPKSEGAASGGSGSFTIGNSQRRGSGASEISYCAAWDPGQFQAIWDTGSGSFTDRLMEKLPKCREIKKTSCCTSWDLTLVLPKLQKANLIPPDVKVTDLRVEIPKKTINAITDLKRQSCSQPVKICRRANAAVTLDATSNPLTAATNSCQEWAEIGCASPAFGLLPVSGTAQVPDNTRVKISWKGVNVKPGSVEVDMTKPEFVSTCYEGCKVSKNLAHKTQTVSETLTWVCLDPRFANVVANQ